MRNKGVFGIDLLQVQRGLSSVAISDGLCDSFFLRTRVLLAVVQSKNDKIPLFFLRRVIIFLDTRLNCGKT